MGCREEEWKISCAGSFYPAALLSKSDFVDAIRLITQKPNLPRGTGDNPRGATAAEFWGLSYDAIRGDLRDPIVGELGKQKGIAGTSRDLIRRVRNGIERELTGRSDFTKLEAETLSKPDVAVGPTGNRKWQA